VKIYLNLKKSNLFSYVSKAIYITGFILIFYIFYKNNAQILILLEKITFKLLCILISIGILRSYLESNVLFLFIKKFCQNINYFDLLNIYLKSALNNHSIPYYGSIYGSFLLKKRGLNYVDYIFCLTLSKLLKILFNLIFVLILFLVFLREYLNINSVFLLFKIFLIGSLFILITSFIFIKLFKKNKKLIKLWKYFKQSLQKKINLNIVIYIFLIVLIDFAIFYLVFTTLTAQPLNLLIIIYIFRIILAYIPIIQIDSAFIVTTTAVAFLVGLNFADSFLINLSTTLVSIISLIVSIVILQFFIFLNLKKKSKNI
jgi:hypothetical protein